jgi:hypothetical protein
MSIYRDSCRVTERVAMKKLFAQGQGVKQISTRLRVHERIVTEVVEGKWDAQEKAQTLASMEANRLKTIGKIDAESNKIAQIAAAAAAAITGQTKVVDEASLRAKIEAEVRAEMAAQLTPPPVELSPQKRAAITRKANAEAAELEAAAEAAEIPNVA